MQLRVIRAFKSTLEDIEDRRSIHSLRSLRNTQSTIGPSGPALSSLFYQNRAFFKNQHSNPQTSQSGNISITVPQLISEPLNINNINARYMDDDGPTLGDRSSTNTVGQSKETRI